jgi:hypothetical protein
MDGPPADGGLAVVVVGWVVAVVAGAAPGESADPDAEKAEYGYGQEDAQAKLGPHHLSIGRRVSPLNEKGRGFPRPFPVSGEMP